jgi:hypothetical protein
MNEHAAFSRAPSKGTAGSAQATTQKPSKAAMFARAQRLKTQIVVGSVVTFLGVSALAAGHQVGSAASQATATNATTAPSYSDDGGFFSQGGADDQQGYSLQQGNSFQAPVSGTSVS